MNRPCRQLNLIRQVYDSNYAFTIVELLVAIVVIGILAVISLVAYGSVSQRAVAASL